MRKSEVRFETRSRRARARPRSRRRGARGLELFDLLIDAHRLGRRAADRLEAAGPGRPRRDEADMADDRNAFGRELADRLKARGAVERVAADHQAGMGGAQIVLVGAVLAVDEADLHEAVARRFAHRRRPQGLDDRENVNPGRRGRRRLVERLDEQHRQLPLALEQAQVADRHSLVFRQRHPMNPLAPSALGYRPAPDEGQGQGAASGAPGVSGSRSLASCRNKPALCEFCPSDLATRQRGTKFRLAC